MNAVIVSFDSLATNSIGCYGNDWIETPNLDRLAATGAIFDRHFADTVGPQAGMTWAKGRSIASTANRSSVMSLGGILKSFAVDARLITAGPLHDWQQDAEFHNVQQVQGNDGPDAKPDEVSFAQVVRAGISAWNDSATDIASRLLWLHSPGPGIPPEGFDELYFEDFLERGQNLAELSDESLCHHPAIYAGAVSLLDHWLGELIGNVEQVTVNKPLMLIVTAAQGHVWQQIEPSQSDISQGPQVTLGDQLARTPLLIKIYGDDRFQDFISLRSDRLVQTCDLIPTLLHWFGNQSASEESDLTGRSLLRELLEVAPARSHVCISDGSSCDAVRTADWLCVRDQSRRSRPDTLSTDRTSFVSLFVKPEDMWDINNVASQQTEIVDELLRLIPVPQ